MGVLHPPSQIRRSAYLAQALQSIRRSGAQTLRTRGALASNLLAEALLALAAHHANAPPAQAEQADQADQADDDNASAGQAAPAAPPPLAAGAPGLASGSPQGPVMWTGKGLDWTNG